MGNSYAIAYQGFLEPRHRKTCDSIRCWNIYEYSQHQLRAQETDGNILNGISFASALRKTSLVRKEEKRKRLDNLKVPAFAINTRKFVNHPNIRPIVLELVPHCPELVCKIVRQRIRKAYLLRGKVRVGIHPLEHLGWGLAI